MYDPNTFVIHKKIRGNWVWKDPIAFRVLADLLCEVNWDEATYNNGIKLEPGQAIYSRNMGAKSLDLTESQVRAALSRLEKHGTITIETVFWQRPKCARNAPETRPKCARKVNLVTLCNHSAYQPPKSAERPKRARNAPEMRPKCATEEIPKGISTTNSLASPPIPAGVGGGEAGQSSAAPVTSDDPYGTLAAADFARERRRRMRMNGRTIKEL